MGFQFLIDFVPQLLYLMQQFILLIIDLNLIQAGKRTVSVSSAHNASVLRWYSFNPSW